jgi:putative transcriptional regulator
VEDLMNNSNFGTIKIRVAEIMKERDLTAADLMRVAGIAYNTALALQRGTPARLDLNTLARLCYALKVEPGDLLEYVPPSPEPLTEPFSEGGNQ